MFREIAKLITELYRENGKLPFKTNPFVYHEISASYYKPGSNDEDFASFFYTNDWHNENVEDNYAFFFGPSFTLKEVLPEIWDKLTYEQQNYIMALTLGKK